MLKTPLALTAALALISSAPIAHAATLTTGASALEPIPSDFTISGNTLTAGPLSTFTDVSFEVSGSSNFVTSGNPRVTVTGTAPSSNTLTFSVPSRIAFGSTPFGPNDFTLTSTTGPLTSVTISALGLATINGITVNPISFTGLSGLEVVPLPASLPLFASGLGALGLMGWRRKRKSRVSLLGAS